MGKTTNIFFLYKISKKEHLKSLAEGKVFFSCCRKYVDITKKVVIRDKVINTNAFLQNIYLKIVKNQSGDIKIFSAEIY